jgi:hypothetical protein
VLHVGSNRVTPFFIFNHYMYTPLVHYAVGFPPLAPCPVRGTSVPVLSGPAKGPFVPYLGWVSLQRSCLSDPCNPFFFFVL